MARQQKRKFFDLHVSTWDADMNHEHLGTRHAREVVIEPRDETGWLRSVRVEVDGDRVWIKVRLYDERAPALDLRVASDGHFTFDN